MSSKKSDAQSPSAENTAAYEEQKFDVLVTKAICYWHKDVVQRGYDPEGDFGSHTQANWKKESAKEISAARLMIIKDLLKGYAMLFIYCSFPNAGRWIR